MKKILSLTLISAIALVLSTGCSSKNPNIPANEDLDAKVSADALYVKTHDNEKIAKAIKKAGEKTGWIITEFKNNEVIAEKLDGEKTISSSVTFSDGHIEFENGSATSDLRDAIEEELNKAAEAH